MLKAKKKSWKKERIIDKKTCLRWRGKYQKDMLKVKGKAGRWFGSTPSVISGCHVPPPPPRERASTRRMDKLVFLASKYHTSIAHISHHRRTFSSKTYSSKTYSEIINTNPNIFLRKILDTPFQVLNAPSYVTNTPSQCRRHQVCQLKQQVRQPKQQARQL